MEHSLTKEVAQAMRRGEVNYAETLRDMELVRTKETTPVHIDHLNHNQRQGYDHLVRKIRDAV